MNPSGSPSPLAAHLRKRHQPVKGQREKYYAQEPARTAEFRFLLDQELSELRQRQLRRGGEPARWRDRRSQQQGFRRAGPPVHVERVACLSRRRTKRRIRRFRQVAPADMDGSTSRDLDPRRAGRACRLSEGPLSGRRWLSGRRDGREAPVGSEARSSPRPSWRGVGRGPFLLCHAISGNARFAGYSANNVTVTA